MKKRSAKKRIKRGRPSYAELEKLVREQQKAIAQLRKKVQELEERLGLNSQNSSIPPSKDPLDAPARPAKKATGRRRGGQPGHKGKRRELLPTEEADEVIHHVPSHCECCRSPLPEKPGEDDPPPERHQVIELPEQPYTLTEHQAHARTCPECGAITRAETPAEHRSAFGPRLVALIAYLTGALKTSRRDTERFVGDVLGISISLGSVSQLEEELSESLVEAYTEAAEAVREADRKNVDETGWKKAGKKCWLWAAATPLLAFYLISPSRGKKGFLALLDRIRGFITSDRWHVYAEVKTCWRQICWAHLKRDFKRLAGRTGEAGRIGEEALVCTAHVFMLWQDFKNGEIDRRGLNQCLRLLKADMRAFLERGVALDMKKVSIFCQNLLDLEPALWNFAKHEGIEPTNNHAERILRFAVIWRKISFGADSERGCRYVERMLTVVQSCRLQKRRAYEFLVESLRGHRAGARGPSLIPGRT